MGKQKKNQKKKQNNNKGNKKQQPEITLKQQGRTTFKETVLLIPALFLVTVYMFCVRGRIIPSNLSDFAWSVSSELTGDIYAYFRMQIFVIFTIAAILCLLIYLYHDYIDITKHIVYIPMAVYTVAVVLSYAFAEYKDIALLGAFERYEGTITLVCYMCILFYAMHAVRNERGVKLVVRGFCIACLILGIWGILQVNGIRLGTLPAWLYVPWDMLEIAEATSASVLTTVTWFFSNPNYASFFMVFPICIFAMTCISREDTKGQVIYAALTGLMMYNLWQSGSIGGMAGLAVAFVAALLMAGIKNIWKWRKNLGFLVIFGVISMLLSYTVISGQVQSSIPAESAPAAKVEVAPEATPETASEEQMETETAAAPTEQAPVTLQDSYIDHIITDGSNLIFSFAGEEYTIVVENSAVKTVTDSAGNNIPHSNALFAVSIGTDEATGHDVINVATAKRTWKFMELEGGELNFVSPSGQPVKLDKVERIGFEGNEKFGTGRGYIWSRTLPMIKETILIGNGADTYIAHFPHEDYAGRYNVNMFTDTANTIVDKPHNMYLEIAANTGVLSLLAFIAIYLIYMIETIKTYRGHEFRDFKDYMGMAVFIATIGFLFGGLVYDSTVQMMPVVYVFLGMGFAINRMLLAEKGERKE